MKSKKVTIVLAVGVALAVLIPWLILGGDLGEGQAAGSVDCSFVWWC